MRHELNLAPPRPTSLHPPLPLLAPPPPNSTPLADPHLHDHVSALYRSIRNKALTQVGGHHGGHREETMWRRTGKAKGRDIRRRKQLFRAGCDAVRMHRGASGEVLWWQGALGAGGIPWGNSGSAGSPGSNQAV